MTAAELITLALREIGVVSATDAPTAEDADLGLAKLRLLMEEWATQGVGVYHSVTLAEDLTLPTGAQPALMLSLAEALCSPFGVAPPPMLPRDAQRARGRYFATFDTPPKIETQDAGMPRPEPSTWDYRTGTF